MNKFHTTGLSKVTVPKSKKLFTSFIVILIILGFISSAWFILQILKPINLSSPVFTIQPGEGVNQISYNLKQEGIINSSFAFETYAFLKGVEGEFKAGEYDLPAVLNIKRLVEILTTGQSAEEWDLTVPEGWTAKDIATKLENLGKFNSSDFLKIVGAGQLKNQLKFDVSDYIFLEDKPENSSLEGYLFPDTYRYFTYSTVDDVVIKMLNNFDKKLTPELREAIKEQGKTIFEIVTMASIIEREVQNNDDMALVSGIFWKRLEIGMALQADSTVNYITGKKTPSVPLADLEIDSLYNTYKYKGLPPGPISNPGITAIKAAIYPQPSSYLYFLTDSKGRVYYAKDFNGHIDNKNKYL